MVDLKNMNIKDILELGIRSENDSQEFYKKLSKKEGITEPLKKKLIHLEELEKEHEKILRNIYDDMFPNEELNLPEISIKPLKKFEITKGETIELVTLLKQAMKSEKEAEKFYKDLAKQFEEEEKVKLAKYLAKLENGHYKHLKHELEIEELFGPARQKYYIRWGAGPV